ncbi:hypothetical protein [Algoriphagus mannitolivorans]|uniref:hypothetical protein n=1 Tax=Algoriphagus mannitolivorans TaxID=226504 RepID=UPI00041BF534|nr:hypothetical protein [Algoriphagus mannitolivorans]
MNILFFLIFVILNFPNQETECSCDDKADLEISQLAKSGLVFRGEVLEKRTENFQDLGYRRIAIFKVNEVFLGDLVEAKVEIGYVFMGPCTVDFHPKNEYLVIADTIPGFSWFSTGYCSGSRRIRDMSKKDQSLLEEYLKAN